VWRRWLTCTDLMSPSQVREGVHGRFVSVRPRQLSIAVVHMTLAVVLLHVASAVAQTPPTTDSSDPRPKAAETIEVSRIVIDAHVLDPDSQLVTNLTSDDFIVRVDGKQAKIETVEWVNELPSEMVETDEKGVEISRTPQPAPGRLFVYYVQTEFARNSPRVMGEMAVVRAIRKYIDLLQVNDRVAILQFDSHLKLRLDFTGDHRQIEEAFARVLLIDEPPPPPAVPSPSLASLLDRDQMRITYSDEKALTLLAHALGKIDGAKKVILFGWGLDTADSRMNVSPRVVLAAGELAAARATLYSFNFGLGGRMRFGMQEVAEDTGGFYSPLSRNGFERLRALLQGHYEIEVRDPVPSVPGKLHRIEVRARRKGLVVEARSSFVDQE
jgi:VWFA-related protein